MAGSLRYREVSSGVSEIRDIEKGLELGEINLNSIYRRISENIFLALEKLQDNRCV